RRPGKPSPTSPGKRLIPGWRTDGRPGGAPTNRLGFLSGLGEIRVRQRMKPADLVIHNSKVITVDAQFSVAQAVAIRVERIAAVGTNERINRLIGPDTRVIDGRGKAVLPGLCDSHVHSYRASVSETGGPAPRLNSLAEAFPYIRQQAAAQPPGTWIVLERVY